MNCLITGRRFLQVALTVGLLSCATGLFAEENAAIEQRLADSAKFLSSDALEGRGIGLPGLDEAADYIADQFARIGLKTDLYDGTAFQQFTMSTGSKRGSHNALALVAPDGNVTELKLDETFTPLAIGGGGKLDVPLVFAGYGITGKEEGYDDYAGLDVKGKAVIVLRHEPQQANPHSKFNGDKHSSHAAFARKVSNAYEHGAAAVLFVSDEFDIQKNVAQFESRWQTAIDELADAQAKFKQLPEPSDDMRLKHRETVARLTGEIQKWQKQIVEAEDPILTFQGAGESGEKRNMPVFFCRRSAIDRVITAAVHQDLAALERKIDETLKPHSAELTGWKARGQSDVITTEAKVKNVVGVLEGEGPTADETIVIGAHYDHWGRGGSGSAAPGSTEIHNGADDNASGVAALLEIARELKAYGKLPRRIVFVAFTGEEEGLIGSARYVREPLFPLDQTVAMLNLDMVGRLQDDKLMIYGTGTAESFDDLAERLAADGKFKLTKHAEGFGPSDHSSFYAKQIPVLHFFTGTHSDYHRPSDDFDKLNIPGMRRIARTVTEAAIAIATAPERPKFVEVKSNQFAGGGGDRPYFGSIPDFAQDKPGYALMGVTKGSPAEKAGLRAGDIIVQFGESKVGNLSDFDSALRKFKAGDKVPIVAHRGHETINLQVVLDPPK